MQTWVQTLSPLVNLHENENVLQKYGLKVYLRNPSSYTPLLEPGGKDRKAHSLCLGPDAEQNKKQISQFSDRDAQVKHKNEQIN